MPLRTCFLLIALVGLSACNSKTPPSHAPASITEPEAPATQAAETAPVKFELRDDCLGDCLRTCQPFANDFDRCKKAYSAGCFGETPAEGFDCSPFVEPATDETLEAKEPSKKSSPATAAPPAAPAEKQREEKRSDPGLKMVD